MKHKKKKIYIIVDVFKFGYIYICMTDSLNIIVLKSVYINTDDCIRHCGFSFCFQRIQLNHNEDSKKILLVLLIKIESCFRDDLLIFITNVSSYLLKIYLISTTYVID